MSPEGVHHLAPKRVCSVLVPIERKKSCFDRYLRSCSNQGALVALFRTRSKQHLTGLLLASRAGIKLEAVSYTGGSAAAPRFRFTSCFEAQIEILSNTRDEYAHRRQSHHRSQRFLLVEMELRKGHQLVRFGETVLSRFGVFADHDAGATPAPR